MELAHHALVGIASGALRGRLGSLTKTIHS